MRVYEGKTAEQRQSERRERLIGAATELFGTRGFGATSARAVLRQAGLQDRYFAESFENLPELLAAVLDNIHAAAIADAVKAIDSSAPPLVQFRQMVAATTACFELNPHWGRIKLVEALGVSPLVEAHRARGLTEYANLVEGFLPPTSEAAQRPALARAVVSGVNGLLTDWITGSFDEKRDDVVEHAALLFGGVLHAVQSPTGVPAK